MDILCKHDEKVNLIKIDIFHCVGLPKGDAPGPAPAHGNANIARGHVHALETVRGNHRGLTQVKDVPENEKRNGKRKDCLPYDPRL